MLFFKSPLHSIRKTVLFKGLLQSRLNKPKLCNVGFNHKVALRPLTHASIKWGKERLEPNIRKLVCSIGRQLDIQNDNGWFFDVGANVGLYSWEMRKFCPNRKILAFEPDPKNFELLKSTVEAGDLKNLLLSPYALSNKAEEACFFQDTLTSATGTISKTNIPWIEKYLNGKSNKIMVDCKDLDSLIDEDKIPSLVKIDVEGHEVQALEGACSILSKRKPLLIIESFPPNREKTIELLNAHEYKFFDADTSQSVIEKTNNLFAWHPQGPLEEATIQKLIN